MRILFQLLFARLYLISILIHISYPSARTISKHFQPLSKWTEMPFSTVKSFTIFHFVEYHWWGFNTWRVHTIHVANSILFLCPRHKMAGAYSVTPFRHSVIPSFRPSVIFRIQFPLITSVIHGDFQMKFGT